MIYIKEGTNPMCTALTANPMCLHILPMRVTTPHISKTFPAPTDSSLQLPCQRKADSDFSHYTLVSPCLEHFINRIIQRYSSVSAIHYVQEHRPSLLHVSVLVFSKIINVFGIVSYIKKATYINEYA